MERETRHQVSLRDPPQQPLSQIPKVGKVQPSSSLFSSYFLKELRKSKIEPPHIFLCLVVLKKTMDVGSKRMSSSGDGIKYKIVYIHARYRRVSALNTISGASRLYLEQYSLYCRFLCVC